jgi:hypothetical protein
MISIPTKRTSLLFLFAGVIGLLLSSGFSAACQSLVTTSIHTQPQGGQHRALLVGIGAYDRGINRDDGFGPLTVGPDLVNLSYVLKTYYSFPEANIRVLLNETATQENIIREFKEQLIDKAKPGDQVVFYYTGHGHFVIDTSGDETADHLDEVLVTWVPKEKQTLSPEKRHALMYMLDDTYESLLQQLSQKMRGADGKVAGSITVIFDSCHSGSATKGLLIPKGRPWDEKIDGPLPAVQNRELASGWLSRKDEFDGVVFLAASQSDQSSYMMTDSKKGSILTYTLTQFLTNLATGTSANITYKQMFDSIAPTISAMKAMQDPQIEGPINTLLFGDGKPANTESLPVVRKVLQGPLRLELSEGFLHGVTKGSRYDIYRSGKDIKDPVNKMAEIEITEVESISSTGRVTTASTPPPKTSDYLAAQAVVTATHFEGDPLKVLIQSDLATDKAKVLSDAVSNLAFIARAGASDTSFDVKLGWCKDTKDMWCKGNKDAYFFQRADGGAVSLGSTIEAESLQKRLLADWRWKRLAGLSLPDPPLVRIEMTNPDGSPVRRTEGGRILLKPGDTLRVSVTNNAGSPMFITLIYLKNSGDIEVYPGTDVANAQQALNADSKPVKLFNLTDISAPNGKEVEILKIIATPRQTDFSGLHYVGEERKGKAKGPPNPLEDLLFGIVDANAKSGVFKSDQMKNWYTDQIVYEIEPN